MPRRGRASSPAPAPRSSVPARVAPPAPTAPAPVMMQQQQPGLLKQMAATAGGVAVGSAVGHVVGHGLTSMLSGGSSQPAAATPEAVQYQQGAQQSAGGPQQEPTGPCAWEIKQFLKCAQDQSDLALCSGFNEAIRQCKETHRLA